MSSLKSRSRSQIRQSHPDPSTVDLPGPVLERLDYSKPLMHIYQYLVAVDDYQHYRDIADSDHVDRAPTNVSNHLNDERLSEMLIAERRDGKKHVRVVEEWTPDQVEPLEIESPPGSIRESLEEEPQDLLFVLSVFSLFGLLAILVELSSLPTTLPLRPLYLLTGTPIGGLVAVVLRAARRVK